MIETIVKILGVSKNSYWNYKNQNRPIILLLEKYFSKEDLQEFLDTSKISKFEQVSTSHREIELLQSWTIDDALYSAKVKLLSLTAPAPNIEIIIFANVIESIKINELNIENAKNIFVNQLKGFGMNIKEKRDKKYLIENIIEDYFSKLECFAICKHESVFREIYTKK
jgi:hypothetical protein